MWVNSPVLQINAFCFLIPTFEVKASDPGFFYVGVNIVVMCFNNFLTYLHVRFHNQFVMWYQNSCMI
jgi:hypothetical protein